MAVSIGRIYESLAQYERDNYYLKDATPQKFGRGWERLGNVQINDKTYNSLAHGKDPISGAKLVDDRNGHRLGYNITFSPDKSFSVAAFSSPELKNVLMEAHQQAVRDTLSYLEFNLAQVRMGLNGEVTPVKTGNIVAFTIDHTCNRDGDVQIHTHAVVFNMSYNELNGQWQALHSDAFKSDILERVYENQLAYHLQARGFVVEWKSSETGKSFYASLAGVPQQAIQATSHRAEVIKEVAEQLKEKYPNASFGELKQIAAYMTRPDKVSLTHEQIQKQFEERLSQVGLTKEDVIKGIEKAMDQAKGQGYAKMNEYDVVKQAFSVVSEQKAVFGEQDLIKASLDISRGDVSLDRIQQAIEDFIKDKSLVRLADNVKMQSGSRSFSDSLYTTKENLVAEKNIFKIVNSLKNQFEPISKNALQDIKNYENATGFKLTESQIKALETALSTRDGVTLYQGFAGTGKTAVLSALQSIAQEHGYKVLGLSETNVAVGEMRNVGIEAYTVTKFLNSPDLQSLVNDKTILIVDECSFMGAKNMESVLKVAQEYGARVMMFGDKYQLPPISAGFPFRDLQEKNIATVVELKDVIRQKDQTLKEAVKAIIKHDIDKAFAKLDVCEIKENIYKETARLYVNAGGYTNTIISTYTNVDKNLLNHEIRELLKENNVIAKEGNNFVVYTPKNLQGVEKLNIHNYKIGDKLIVTKSGAGVKVGAELTIKQVDYKNHTLKAEGITKQGVKEYLIDVRHFGDRFNVYSMEVKEFSVGDKIIFNANLKLDNGEKVANSTVGYISNIKDNYITVQTKDGSVTFDASKFQYFDHGYAHTTYKAQGKTAERSIYFAPVSDQRMEAGVQRNYQDFYVAISRATIKSTIVTNNVEKLKEQVKELQQKESITSAEQRYNLSVDSTYKEITEELGKESQFGSEFESKELGKESQFRSEFESKELGKESQFRSEFESKELEKESQFGSEFESKELEKESQFGSEFESRSLSK